MGSFPVVRVGSVWIGTRLLANVIFKVGTKALFDALEQKDTNTLYWLEDVQELYKGNLLFATGKTASETAAGLMSAEDMDKDIMTNLRLNQI